MFTGIIEATGNLEKVQANGSNKTFLIRSPISHELKPDQSVAHDGVCLTIEAIGQDVHQVTAIQETLNNAIRHARATTVAIKFTKRKNNIEIAIEDDGIGFDREEVVQRAKRGEHLGLLGMTERARSVGGTIDIDSRPGKGSRIEVRIPLADQEIQS